MVHLFISVISVYSAEESDRGRTEVLSHRQPPFIDWEERGSDKQDFNSHGQVELVCGYLNGIVGVAAFPYCRYFGYFLLTEQLLLLD